MCLPVIARLVPTLLVKFCTHAGVIKGGVLVFPWLLAVPSARFRFTYSFHSMFVGVFKGSVERSLLP